MVVSLAESTKAKQETLEFEPEYLESHGIKHEFNGILFVPTADEMKRIEAEQRDRATSPVAFAEPHLFVPVEKPRASVKMKMRDALKFRAK